MCPPHSPTRMTNTSILKLAGAFHGRKTSRIRFWAFSYSIGDPCERSNQLIMYFIDILLDQVDIFRDAPSLDGPTILPFSGERRRSSASVPRPQGRLRAARAGVHPLQRRVGRRSRGVVLLSTTAPVRSDDS